MDLACQQAGVSCSWLCRPNPRKVGFPFPRACLSCDLAPESRATGLCHGALPRQLQTMHPGLCAACRGCGQGMGAVHEVVPAAVPIGRLAAEYADAKQAVAGILGGGFAPKPPWLKKCFT